MKFSSDPKHANLIRSYNPGEIHLQDRVLTTHTIITPDSIITDWQPAELEKLSIADFAPALESNPDIILFGTGAKQRFPKLELLTEIMRAGTAIEVMHTAAACRTFNVLIGENRAVIAALLVE